MEKESAQLRLNRSAALLVVLLFLGTAEFGLVSFIIPAMPGVNPLPTPTIDLLATPTSTLVSNPDPNTTPPSISSPSRYRYDNDRMYCKRSDDNLS